MNSMSEAPNMKDRRIEGLANVPHGARGCVLTIGNFDGVHLGHQHIIASARQLADRNDLPVAALTFDPPPDLVLRPSAVPQRISPSDQKCELLTEAGADYAVTLHTDRQLLAKTADEFVDDIILAAFSPSVVLEGQNFFFGRGREGNIEALVRFGSEKGFDVVIAEPVTIELDAQHLSISSTLVRRLLAGGRVQDAARCLGRDFTLYGRVVPGLQRGRKLDYPTANVDAGDQITPGDGIYAAWATVSGAEYPAAVSIGCNPTFDAAEHAIEAFLLNAEGNLYDETMSLRFLERIRDMQRFDSPQGLKAQIARDVRRVREICR